MRNYLTNIYRWLKASLADTKGFQRSVQLFAGILLLGLVSIKTSAQLGRYQFNGTAICPNNAINVQTQPANATFSGYTTTGTTCVASSSTFLNSAWTTGSTVNVNEYTQFSLTPAASYVLTLTTMTFKHAVSVNGSTTTTWYLRSSVDNYATNIATGASTTGNSTPTITFPAASFTAIGAITFRLYLTNANG